MASTTRCTWCRSRSGSHFDPAIASTVTDDPGPLFQGLDDDTFDRDPRRGAHREATAERRATRPRPRGGRGLLRHALPVLRWPQRRDGGASSGGRRFAATFLRRGDTRSARRVLVHDLGRFGVPASVWDRPGPLNQRDRERMRMHVYYVERIFTRPEPLRRIGLLAAAHHERMDGSGYHRGRRRDNALGRRPSAGSR